MQQLRSRAWNWLPAFLEVAEAGGITEASRRLNLTPAAVSRTVRLLEDHLGEPLFNRVGRSLVLNRRGAALRDSLRTAVGCVDRGLAASLEDPFTGPLCVASLGVLTEHFVLPTLLDLQRQHHGIVPEHLNVGSAEAADRLARGSVDVAFYYEELSVDGLVVELLGNTSVSVYCGHGHPLFARARVSERAMLASAFSVPQIGDSGTVMDGWPSDVSRAVGMRITMLRSNLQVALSGQLLTVLPDVEAAGELAAGRLRRIRFRRLPAIKVFAARAASADERGPVQFLIDRVRARLVDANRALRRTGASGRPVGGRAGHRATKRAGR